MVSFCVVFIIRMMRHDGLYQNDPCIKNSAFVVWNVQHFPWAILDGKKM